MRGGRQADDIQARGAVTKARDRLAPIVPLAVALDFLLGRALAVLNEPGAAPTGNDLALELGDGPRRGNVSSFVCIGGHVSSLSLSPRLALQTQHILHERPHAKAGAASRGLL